MIPDSTMVSRYLAGARDYKMELKAKDAEREARSQRWKRDKWRKEIESKNEVSKNRVRKLNTKLKVESNQLREEIQVKNSKIEITTNKF